jgi:hypothetical protein
MKTTTFVVALALLAGCAGQDEKETTSKQDITQAVRDFIEVRELEPLDQLRSGTNDSWRAVGDMFVIYDGRRDEYLVEFVRRCHELYDNSRITPDKRWDSNVVRARFDTIRGCRIAAIYALDEAEVVELKNIGEAPGSRN